jgi:hypothetical protein
MSVHVLKNNFSRGEFAAKARSRVDLEMYGGAAETVRNFMSETVGGLRRRPGTKYAGAAKNTNTQRFVEFIYSATGDAYILEFGHQYIRFWSSDGTQVTSGTPVEVATTYDSTQIDDLQVVQVGNVVYIAHPDHFPKRLIRASETSWSLSTFEPMDGPYLPVNDSDNSCVSSAIYEVGTATTLTFDSEWNINDGVGFVAGDVGRHIRVLPVGVAASDTGGGGSGRDVSDYSGDAGSENIGLTNRWIHGIITARGSSVSITVDWVRVGDGVSAGDAAAGSLAGGVYTDRTTLWRLGAFGPVPGYPRCVEVFEGRLAFGGTTANPRAIYFSRTNLPGDYAPSAGDSTVFADHGFGLDIIASGADRILWLKEAPRLQVGTPSGIRTVGGTDTSQPMSPFNISQRLEVTTGVSDAIPISANSSSIVVSRDGRTIHNVYFDFQTNSLQAPAISRLSSHLFSFPVKKLAFAQVPEPIIWVLTTAGELRGITFDQQERVIGFHRHDFGDDSTVVSIGVIPTAERDVLWLLMERSINGSTVHYVEYLSANYHETDGALEDAYFVDAGSSYSGVATNTVTGLTHLANTAVQVLADGSYKQGLTVSAGGVLTLAGGETAEKIHVGIGMESEFQTLRPPLQVQDGHTIGRKVSAQKVLIDVIGTGPLRVGANSDSAEEIQHRRTDQGFGEAPDLKDGTYSVPLEDRRTGGARVYGIMDTPHPAFIRSLLVQVEFEGRG